MPPRETNKVSAGRAKVKDTAKSNPVASTASRASAGARATRSVPRKTTAVSTPVGGTTLSGPGAKGRVKPPEFMFPVQGGKVTQQVGVANPRRGYQSGRNEGLDIAASIGTPVTAGARGTVIGVNPNAGAYGNQVVVDFGGGRQVAYNHLSGFGDIKKGQSVDASTVIGQVGTSGNTTGPHLDLEATVNGTSVPLATAFKGYQFDEAFGGSEQGLSDTGFNRSQNKFYSLGDLSKSSGSSFASGSGTGTSYKPNSVGSTGSTGFSSGQFVNLASLVTPGINRGMKRFSSAFKPSSSMTPFKSPSYSTPSTSNVTSPVKSSM